MRFDLHVGLAVRTCLCRARKLDRACRFDVRELLKGRTLDVDIARLRIAADLDLPVIRVVDVPIVCARADVDCLRLVRLFECERLADVDLIAKIHVVGFELRIVRGIQVARDREFLACVQLNIRGLRLESVDVRLRRDRAVLHDRDLHIRLVFEFERALRHIGGDVADLVRLRGEIHRALTEKQQVPDLNRRGLGQPVAVQGERIRRRSLHRAHDGDRPVRQNARMGGQVAARNGIDRRRARVRLVADRDVVEIARLDPAKSRIRNERARPADGKRTRRLGLNRKCPLTCRVGKGNVAPIRDAVGGHRHRARASREACTRAEINGVGAKSRILPVRVRERARDFDRRAGFHGQRRLHVRRADVDVARIRVAEVHFARAGVDKSEVRHVHVGGSRADGHCLARRPGLDRDRAVCTRKRALRSCGERQRIRLDFDCSACGRYLAVRAKADGAGFECGCRRPRRFDLGIRVERQCSARLQGERARAVRHAARADGEAARHVKTCAARRSRQPRIGADLEIRAVLKREPLRLAVELSELMRAREVYGRIRRVEHERVRREDARPRDRVLRPECQRMTCGIDRAADRQRACAGIQREVMIRRHAAYRDICRLICIADDVLIEIRYLARARERIARELKLA